MSLLAETLEPVEMLTGRREVGEKSGGFVGVWVKSLLAETW